MSNVNIKRAVENIRGNTTVYTPVVEVISWDKILKDAHMRNKIFFQKLGI